MGHGVHDFHDEVTKAPKKENESLRAMTELANEKQRELSEEKQKSALLSAGIEPEFVPTQEEISAAKQAILYDPEKLHAAIAGSSGTGKSSLINAFRRCSNKDAASAATGITQTTLSIDRYPDPDAELPFSRFVWYDIPGSGTPDVDDWGYVQKQALYVFDIIILAISNRFTKADATLLKHCQRLGVPTFVVRSKADNDIRDIKDNEEDWSTDEARRYLVKQVNQAVTRDLAREGIALHTTFVVSAKGVLKCSRLFREVAKAKGLKEQTRLYHNFRNGRAPFANVEVPLVDEFVLLEEVFVALMKRRYGDDNCNIQKLESALQDVAERNAHACEMIPQVDAAGDIREGRYLGVYVSADGDPVQH